MKFSKENRRKRIHNRVRNKIKGTADRPRISVFRSNKEIYCQLVDDRSGHTLVAASSRDAGVCDKSTTKVEQAKMVGKTLAEKAQAANITTVVFDRSGYLYHGRVKALADGAREGGLQF
ncbi:MAG: 50S ribosomal protein L18 [Bacteroidota bacterium]